MLPPIPPHYTLVYQASPPVLWGRPHRPLSPEEITEVCELMLAYALHHRCHYWLLDNRVDAAPLPSDLYQWMREDYLPRVRTVLGQSPLRAFVIPAAAWAMKQGQGDSMPDVEPRNLFQTGWFTEEAPARAWLDQFRWR